MSKIFKVFLLISVFICSQSFAEIAVVVHPSNTAEISADDIERIFLGKKKTFSSGETAVPINLNESNSTRDGFNEKALNKSSSQLKAYWSKLVFTGKGTPPKEVDSAQEVIKLVSSNPNMIGYVDSSNIDSSVKVITKFE
ncbi:phosphate ABC transporter substrate-binding protein [Catenovulum sp. 2E275]|uniref:phosphate ABC transporter substrate-binding protein n=1 Tax=Catenovulum sp. 2E275 TaxID=2980497 RepID=UPI0021D0415E|nr:phosphate ABC transporter substrate-binding protein [Catenovulum sp. 2E275]MCU4675653.1 phosphate ABC transporter substrate-binding protein [Catenovulum sp. 2E275]